MAERIAISARELSKSYRLWSHPGARFKAPLLRAVATAFPAGPGLRARLDRAAAAGGRDVHALHPLSFTIRRGEAVGIIGRNGSGKSTLLQLIAGILQPTSGSITSEGRISALLELGSGFNPEFTGRENVYLNGSILGLTAREIDARFDQIAAFADIGDFIEEPVKTYSSGMIMRLAFAVAVTVQPDILIVDEALSVGDVFFTQKCFTRIREILDGGATLIFVSHDTAAVQNLCTRGLLLHQGQLIHDGPPEECVSRYFGLHQPAAVATPLANSGPSSAVNEQVRAALHQANLLPKARSRHGDRRIEVLAAAVLDARGQPTMEFEMMHWATVRLHLRANGPVNRPSIGIQLHDRMSNLIFAAGNSQLHHAVAALTAGDELLLDFRVRLTIQPGEYTLSVDAAEQDAENPNVGHFFDRIGGLGPLIVCHHANVTLPFYGIAQLPMEISQIR